MHACKCVCTYVSMYVCRGEARQSYLAMISLAVVWALSACTRAHIGQALVQSC